MKCRRIICSVITCCLIYWIMSITLDVNASNDINTYESEIEEDNFFSDLDSESADNDEGIQNEVDFINRSESDTSYVDSGAEHINVIEYDVNEMEGYMEQINDIEQNVKYIRENIDGKSNIDGEKLIYLVIGVIIGVILGYVMNWCIISKSRHYIDNKKKTKKEKIKKNKKIKIDSDIEDTKNSVAMYTITKNVVKEFDGKYEIQDIDKEFHDEIPKTEKKIIIDKKAEQIEKEQIQKSKSESVNIDYYESNELPSKVVFYTQPIANFRALCNGSSDEYILEKSDENAVFMCLEKQLYLNNKLYNNTSKISINEISDSLLERVFEIDIDNRDATDMRVVEVVPATIDIRNGKVVVDKLGKIVLRE